MERVGLDPRNLPVPEGKGMRHDHLPEGVRPWKNLWSAGQGIDLIHDIPSVGELVERLRGEYRAACALPAFGASEGVHCEAEISRSEERRVGKESVSQCSSRWAPYP